MSPWLWLLPPLAPLLGAVLLWPLGRRTAPWLWLAPLPTLLLSFAPPPALTLGWLWAGAQWGGDDGPTRLFLGFSALLWSAAALYAAGSQREDARARRFWLFWLLALSGNLLLIIARDGASFYVGFTLMSLCAYGLVIHRGGGGPRRAGRVYLQLAILGEILIYAGLMLRVHEAGGDFLFSQWQQAPLGVWTAALLLSGFGLKAGFWPLHMWLPLAHPAAPAAASAVLSGAMIKAGILGLWRFLPEADPLLQSWAPWLAAAALFSAFYGVALGLLQSKTKTALAYSSVSQVSYLLLILALAWQHPAAAPAGLVLYALHHGLAKGALFLAAGMASVHRLQRWCWPLLALPALALAGLPFTTGAVVKTQLKDAFAQSDFAHWGLLLSLGSGATALLLLRVLWLFRQQQRAMSREQDRPPAYLLLPWALLSLSPLLLWPLMLAGSGTSLSLSGLWSSLWPPLLALAIAAVALVKRWRIPASLRHLPSPAVTLSLQLQRLLQPPKNRRKTTSGRAGGLARRWRRRERHWNRFWQQGTVHIGAWLLLLLLLLGWSW